MTDPAPGPPVNPPHPTVPPDPHARPSRRSAVVAGVIVVVLVAVMVNLGSWQLRRHAEVRDQNAAIEQRAANPVPFDEVAPDGVVADVAAVDFQRVVASGVWRTDVEVLWRGRNRNLIPGFEILTPLELVDDAGTATGTAVLVSRGFLPDTFDDVPTTVAVPPTGIVRIEGILRRDVDQPGFGAQDAADGILPIVFHADVARIEQQVREQVDGLELVDDAYVRLVAASPATESEVLRPLEPIEPDAGPHLGYALQWFGFSTTAVIAYLAWLRTRVRRSDD